MEIVYLGIGVCIGLIPHVIIKLYAMWKNEISFNTKIISIWDGIDSLSADLGGEIDEIKTELRDCTKYTEQYCDALNEITDNKINNVLKLLLRDFNDLNLRLDKLKSKSKSK